MRDLMSTIKKHSTDILNVLLSLILVIGSLTFFRSTCGEDMHCHTANTVITVIGAGLLVLSIVGFLLKGKVEAIVSFLTAAAAIVEALIPGVILSLCMMPSMSCRATMRPWTMLLSFAIALVSILSGIIHIRKK